MSAIGRSVAALRISGDALDPNEITVQIGSRPTTSYRKGDVRKTPRGGEIVRRFGMWLLEAEERKPGDVNAQIQEILSRVTPDLAVWKALSQKWDIDIFFGLFMNESNEGFPLSPSVMTSLGERNITIGFDIYAPSRELESAHFSTASLKL